MKIWIIDDYIVNYSSVFDERVIAARRFILVPDH